MWVCVCVFHVFVIFQVFLFFNVVYITEISLFSIETPLFSTSSHVNQMLLTSSLTTPPPLLPFQSPQFLSFYRFKRQNFLKRESIHFLLNIINLFFPLVIESKFAPPLPSWKERPPTVGRRTSAVAGDVIQIQTLIVFFSADADNADMWRHQYLTVEEELWIKLLWSL